MTQLALIYSTRYGATKGIVERMAGIAQATRIDTQIIDAKTAIKMDLTSFDGIVAGGGIQIGKIPSSLSKFLKKRHATLKLFNDKFAFFICCGAAKDIAGAQEAIDKYLKPILTKYQLSPTKIAAFGGYYDLRPESPFGGIKSAIIRKMIEEESPGQYDLNGMNDLRDWNSIEHWFKLYLDQF